MLQGYALTETCCAGTVQMLRDILFGVVGPPVGSMEIQVRSGINAKGESEVSDRKGRPSLNTDTNHHGAPGRGRGKVLSRSPSVSVGYFKHKEKTDEVFGKGSWFLSGDVGFIIPGGCVQIGDRVKNSVKPMGGEYIAIEAREKEHATCPYVNPVSGGVTCHGDGEMDRPDSLAQVNAGELEKWAKAAGVAFTSADDLCRSPAAEKAVLELLCDGFLAAVADLPGIARWQVGPRKPFVLGRYTGHGVRRSATQISGCKLERCPNLRG